MKKSDERIFYEFSTHEEILNNKKVLFYVYDYEKYMSALKECGMAEFEGF